MRLILCIGLLLVLIAGCTQQQDTALKMCTTHSECTTPENYLIRSSCPFSSYCVEGACQVGCPQPVEAPQQDGSGEFWPTQPCEQDSDCSCKYSGNDFKNCKCIDGGCVALVTPII